MSDASTSTGYSVEKKVNRDETNDLNLIEIDLYEKAKQLWVGRKAILLITALFLGIGLFHYSFAPEEYQSVATLIQEGEGGGASFQGGGGLLQTLAGGLTGQSSSNSLSAAAKGRAPLPVTLYPVIVSSTDFQKDLITREIQFSDPDTTLPLFDYYRDYYEEPYRDRVYSFIGDMTIFLPLTIFDLARDLLRTVVSFFDGNESEKNASEEATEDPMDDSGIGELPENKIQIVSNEEKGVIEILRTKIALTAEGGLTVITITLPDGLAAAHVNAILVEKLQNYITEYRIEKARQNLEAIMEQENEARLRYEAAQMELASFEDQNINLSTNIAQTRVEHLRNQRNLRFQVYNSIAQEVEQARMSLEQQIPLFNILEKPSLPSSPTSGSSNLQLIFSGIIGFFVGIFWVLIRNSALFKL